MRKSVFENQVMSKLIPLSDVHEGTYHCAEKNHWNQIEFSNMRGKFQIETLKDKQSLPLKKHAFENRNEAILKKVCGFFTIEKSMLKRHG